MIIEAVVLSLILGLIRKGKLINFAYLDLKLIYLFIVGSIGQSIVFGMADSQGSGFSLFFYNQFYWLHLVTYLLILIPLLLNLEWQGFRFMAVGTILNFAAIFTNGGMMPVKVPEGYAPVFDMGHTLMTEATNFKFFGDFIFLGPPYPLPKVLSIGDLFLILGVFWFIQTVMMKEFDME